MELTNQFKKGLSEFGFTMEDKYKIARILCNRTFYYFHPTCFEILREKISI